MIIEQLFIATVSAGLAGALLDLIGANLYDVQAVKQQRAFKRHPYAWQYRQRPLVSVIVETCDAAPHIEQCLRSIVGSAYRKLEIIIIDNASRDNTKQLVRQFQAAHPRKAVRLIARRSRQGTPSAIAASIKKYGAGELILQLNSGDVLDKAALSTAVRHFNMEPPLEALVLNRRTLSVFSTIGLLQKYEDLLRSHSKKLWSLSNSALLSSAETIVYRQGALPAMNRAKKDLSRPLCSAYAGDSVVYSTPEQSLYQLIRQQHRRQSANLRLLWQWRASGRRRHSGHYSRLLTQSRWLLALAMAVVSVFVPFLVCYFIYMAVGLHEPAFLVLSWIALGLLILFAIWEDEQLHAPQKTIYSLLIPVTYGLFMLLSFVQVFTIFRTSLMPRKLLRS